MNYDITIVYLKTAKTGHNPYDPPMAEYDLDHQDEFQLEADNDYEALELAKECIENPHFKNGGCVDIFINGVEVYTQDLESYEGDYY